MAFLLNTTARRRRGLMLVYRRQLLPFRESFRRPAAPP